MAVEEGGGIFGFDTPERKKAVRMEFLHLHRNPIIKAAELFGHAVEQDHLLLEFAAQKATQSLERVLNAYAQRGRRVWRILLSDHEEDVLGATYKEGFELARLFINTPEISYHQELQAYYSEIRLKVVTALVTQLPHFSLGQIRDVYDHIGLHPQKDGSFAQTAQLRRSVPVYH